MVRICLSVAHVTFGIECPWPLTAAEYLNIFEIPWQTPDVLYRFLPMERTEELVPVWGSSTPLAYRDGTRLFRVAPRTLVLPELLVCRQSKSLYHIYYPPALEQNPPESVHYPSILAWEENFLDFSGFYLHSSCVKLEDQGVVFTAPSGTGKSTQAALWEQTLGAVILNGDRTVVRRIDGEWRCYGSPYAGSSNIYKNESAGLRAVIVLRQGPDNRLERLGPKDAFINLYRETVQNPWSKDYMAGMSALLWQAVQEIPVYKLTCRPDRDAVELVLRAVFDGGKGGAALCRK